jgi:hypothetical protein
MLINGIGSSVVRGDLLERSLLVELQPIEQGQRKDESEFWADFNASYASILGGLLDAASLALRNVDSVKIENLPRMSAFAKWSSACEKALGCESGEFIDIYRENIGEAKGTALESSPTAMLVCDLLARSKRFWQGTATELLDALRANAGNDDKRLLPLSSRGLSNILKRDAPALRSQGINFDSFKSNGTKLIKLQQIG